MPKYHRNLSIEQLQLRQLLAADIAASVQTDAGSVYSVDGTGNNLTNIEWGSTNENLLRLASAQYSDGISSPAGDDLPSAREISNLLAAQSEDIISDRDLSAFIYAWGQFIDHDIGLTPSSSSETIAIDIPEGDAYFAPDSTGTQQITTHRSLTDPETGTGVDNPLEQVNTITSWIDASMVYGSSQTVSDSLRTFEGGHLKMSADGLLPLNNAENFPDGTLTLDNDAHRVASDELFAAGDVRANENIELTSLQTLFVREHNRLADEYAKQDPSLSDEEIYQMARSMVIAEIQSITYNEWLPAILGTGVVDQYTGYDPTVNPGLSNEFSTAAFRFGHSLLGDDVEFLDENGLEIAEPIALSEAFFNPTILDEVSIDSIFKYLASDPSSELDPLVVDSLRNFLFGPPGAGGLDLASLNIARGRDHGLDDYNATRVAIGLPRVDSFAEITSDVDVQQKLEALYGSVDNIDLWVGLLAEDHMPNSSVGVTLAAIISDQFERIRDGDRLWYQNSLSGSALREVENTQLSDIISRNTGLQNIQDNVFVFEAEISGTVFADPNGNQQLDRAESSLAGWTVELVSEPSGEVVSTAVTNQKGQYQFDVQSGVRTGAYYVQVTSNSTGQAVDFSSAIGSVTSGDQRLRLDIAATTSNSKPRQSPPRHAPQPSKAPQPSHAPQPSKTAQSQPVETAAPPQNSFARAADQFFGALDDLRRRR
jgi:peroxidase